MPSSSFSLVTSLTSGQTIHDYCKSNGGVGDVCPSVAPISLLHQALYSPFKWAPFASGDFYQYYQLAEQTFGSNFTLATRSAQARPWSKRQSGQDFQDYTFQAITCGDSIDQSDVTTQSVFDEFIRVVENVSPMCK